MSNGRHGSTNTQALLERVDTLHSNGAKKICLTFDSTTGAFYVGRAEHRCGRLVTSGSASHIKYYLNNVRVMLCADRSGYVCRI